MRKIAIAFLSLCVLGLAGCGGSSPATGVLDPTVVAWVQKYADAGCNILPLAASVSDVAAQFGGPAVVATEVTAKLLAGKLCDAYKAAEAAASANPATKAVLPGGTVTFAMPDGTKVEAVKTK